MPTETSQVRYTDTEVTQLKTLFPDVASLKLYRKYLLDLPLTPEEIALATTLWSSPSVRSVIVKCTVPVITGDEPIGVGYDFLNNIPLGETNSDYVIQRTGLFVAAIKYLSARIDGLSDVADACTGKGAWLTAFVLGGGLKDPVTRFDQKDNTDTILTQLCIKQNVEGILVGLNAIVSMTVETEEEKAARISADSTI